MQRALRIRHGFTMVELMISIGVFAVIAAAVISSLNLRAHLISARDAERFMNAKQMQNAMFQYMVQHSEMLASQSVLEGKAQAKPICKEGVSDCLAEGGVPLEDLAPEFLVNLPIDPLEKCNAYTGYKIYKTAERPRVFSAYLGMLMDDEVMPDCGVGGYCGDSTVNSSEECDDGNERSGDGCVTCVAEPGYVCTGGSPSVCSASCGDGVIDAGESCDDENLTDGDGCSDNCVVETGYECAGVPSACHLIVCGDGVVETGEECDDGNTGVGDGCDAVCSTEDGWGCIGDPSACGPLCNGQIATVFVNASNIIVGGPDDGLPYAGILNGSILSDVMVGTDGDDEINGGNGGDIICALGGDDSILDTGNASDTIFGGDGNDTISGENGNDTLCGGAGDDIINGDNGDDDIDGGPGNDTIDGGSAPDTCVNGENVSNCSTTTGSVPACEGS